MQLLPLLKQVPASGIPRASNLVNNDTENKQNSTYFPGSTSIIWKPVEIKFITLTKSTLHYGTEYKASWDLSGRGVWHQLDWSTPTYLDLTSVGIHMTHTCFTPQRRVKECSSNRFIISKGIIKSIWQNTLRNRVTQESTGQDSHNQSSIGVYYTDTRDKKIISLPMFGPKFMNTCKMGVMISMSEATLNWVIICLNTGYCWKLTESSIFPMACFTIKCRLLSRLVLSSWF